MTNELHNPPIQPTALRYGGITSLILIVLGLVYYLTDMIDYTGQTSNWLTTAINYGIMIGGIVLAIKYYRDEEMGGSIKFGKAFKVGMATGLIMAVITAIWTYIFFTFISPDLADTIMEASRTQMEDQGMDDDQIDQAIEMTKMFITPGAMTVFALFGTVVMAAIIAAIGGAIMKTE